MENVLQEEYQNSTSRSDWRDLPINVETLTVSWEEWQPDAVYRYGLEHSVGIKHELSRESPLFLSQIASLCSAMRIAKIGELHELYESKATLQLLESRFEKMGTYSLEYFALLTLYIVAASRGVDLPKNIEVGRLDQSVKEEYRADRSQEQENP